MIFLFVCCNTTTNKNIIETEISDFDKILDSFQVNGSILIYDNDKNTFYSNDFDWAKNGKLPASTFKIPNSIIAVELGIIENDTTILKWNGEQSKMDIWEKDLSLNSATKLFSVLLASKRPLITELADKLRLKYPLLPTISPCPTMRLEAIRSIIPISCRRYPKSV